jgi:hypothetical protein
MRRVCLSIVILFVFTGLSGCVKEQRITVEEMMIEKDWYLEKKTQGVNTVNFFTGTSTFNFTLISISKRYEDSDGIIGSYTIAQEPNSIALTITAINRAITAYKVKHVGPKHLVLEHGTGNNTVTLYFSARL